MYLFNIFLGGLSPGLKLDAISYFLADDLKKAILFGVLQNFNGVGDHLDRQPNTAQAFFGGSWAVPNWSSNMFLLGLRFYDPLWVSGQRLNPGSFQAKMIMPHVPKHWHPRSRSGALKKIVLKFFALAIRYLPPKSWETL